MLFRVQERKVTQESSCIEKQLHRESHFKGLPLIFKYVFEHLLNHTGIFWPQEYFLLELKKKKKVCVSTRHEEIRAN